MELRDLLIIDIELVSAAQAKYIVRDVIDVLTKPGISGEDQHSLRSLMMKAQEIATGRKVGDSQDTIRAEVLQKIQEAEVRGDKRTARYLTESMAKHDIAAAGAEEHKSANLVQKFVNDETAALKAREKADQERSIELRTQELLRVDGSSYDFSLKLAREQATREIVRPRYEDDINEEPVKPDRQVILDGHKDSA
jgi:hypothetical protein